MSDFVNTIDLLGDDAVMASIIDRSITEFHDNVITSVGTYTFYGCSALTSLKLPNVTSISQNAFEACSSIKEIVLSKPTSLPHQVFRNCVNLKYVDLVKVKSLGNQCFNICKALETLILRSDSVVKLGVNVFYDSSISSCYIYVPSALIDSYKAATNWSTYASQFRALEDYTVDGTITGELDESKI